MIEHLTVVTSKDVVNRDHIESKKLQDFERLTGIKKTRRVFLSPTDFITESVRRAATKTDLRFVDAVIVVTQSPDRLSPCMAMNVMRELNLNSDTVCFDVNQSCDGFIYGMHIAKKLKARVLLVCMDQLRFDQSPTESLIFSDACSVALISSDTFKEYGTATFFSDPSGIEQLYSKLNGSMCMNGGNVYDFVTQRVPELIASQKIASDFLCQHQANLSMMKIVERKSGYSGRSLHSIEEYGNMSMVSIPMALAYNEEKILDKAVLLVGYGAGYCAAAMPIIWSSEKVCQIVEI